jgi:hypothetical protein
VRGWDERVRVRGREIRGMRGREGGGRERLSGREGERAHSHSEIHHTH